MFDIYSYLDRISSLMFKRQKIGLLLWDKLTVIADGTPPFYVSRIEGTDLLQSMFLRISESCEKLYDIVFRSHRRKICEEQTKMKTWFSPIDCIRGGNNQFRFLKTTRFPGPNVNIILSSCLEFMFRWLSSVSTILNYSDDERPELFLPKKEKGKMRSMRFHSRHRYNLSKRVKTEGDYCGL